MIKVLHVIETIAPHEGGPPRVVAGLTVAQRAMGIDAHVLCGDGGLLPEYVRFWEQHAPGYPGPNVHSTSAGAQTFLARRASLRAWLRSNLRNFDVVHIHQLWRIVPTAAARACRRLGIPYLIAPHTSLSPWALGQKRLKKTLARWLVWNRILHGAAGFHALNELEMQEIIQCNGPHGPPVFVVPNGVSLAEFPGVPAQAVPEALASLLVMSTGRQPFILFLARLHIMKGPDLLLNAFASLAGEYPGLQLVYAGPDFGMRGALQRRAADLRLTNRVHFIGMVGGAERLWLLGHALCLSQPSRDEGFSLSILEAMAANCPVVISDRCKFPEVQREGAGTVVPLEGAELAAGLRRYVADPVLRAAAGRAARLLVERRYTWEIVSQQASRMYERAIAGRRGTAAPERGLT